MLAAGTTLGPYRLLGPLGAGGMGEVYRAHDARLGRDVAIKVLPQHLAATPEVRARFEREARTISQLNHPHICTLHDVGHQDGTDYLVMELLEGETLAHRLEKGPLPVAEVLSLGRQIAEALDRAHRAGVVHRDLKPGNVMLTKGGAKLMDFGLARAHGMAAASAMSQSPTVSRPLTAEGTIVGTFQYMAPEQLEGKEADARSDLWALGCVLYEMATGARAFAGESQASLIAAIMKEEPRAMSELRPVTPPALERVVRRCLAKDPEDRLQSARDLAFDLEGVAGSGSGAVPIQTAGVARRPKRFGTTALLVTTLLTALLVAAVTFLTTRRSGSTDVSQLRYTRLTFQRGRVPSARFSPDGRSVFYTAAVDGRPPEVFETTPGLRNSSRSLGLTGAAVTSVSKDGRLAAVVGFREYRDWGTLAEVPTAGGTPRRMLEDIVDSDWAPDGQTLAVVHLVGGKTRLELPPGRVLYENAGLISYPRISRDGRRVAFVDNPFAADTRGTVVIIDTTGRILTRSREWNYPLGVAWASDDREIWYGASDDGATTDIRALTPRGVERVISRFMGGAELADIGPQNQVLLTRYSLEAGMRGSGSPSEEERELGWFDLSVSGDISSDGKMLLFDEQGSYGGPLYSVCLRGTDGSPPVRLGEGCGLALSPDGRWALALHFGPPQRLLLYPTGVGDSTSLPRGGIETYGSGGWLPDGRGIVFSGSERGHARRTYLQDIAGGLPRPISPEGIEGSKVSPDGRTVAALSRDGGLFLCPLSGDSARFVARLQRNERIAGWTSDGGSLYVTQRGIRMSVSRLDLRTGARSPWRTFSLSDPAGIEVHYANISPDGRGYSYSYLRYLGTLYLVEGLK